MIPRYATLSDTALVNSICGDPEVRKWTANDGAPPFDATPWLTSRTALVVLVDGGCFLSNHLGDTTYEVHTNVLPGFRGKAAIINGGLALMLAFLTSPAETFKTRVPANNLRAKWFAEALGFRPTFLQERKWLQGGVLHDIIHYSLSIDEWILRGHLATVGKLFHQEVEKLEGHPPHAEDFAHDCYVGAAVAMCNAGHPTKALKLYNRWALESGYVPMKLLSTSPLVVDAQDFLIEGVKGEMVLKLKEMDHA